MIIDYLKIRIFKAFQFIHSSLLSLQNLLLLMGMLFLASGSAQSGAKFSSKYQCADSGRTCLSGGGTRTIEGEQVYCDCWEWGYTKSCEVPSKNDCKDYDHCYALGTRECLLKDNYGACINWEMEFSCNRFTPTYIETQHVKYDTKDAEGDKVMVCKGVPCIDGNCIDKSYEMDGEMMNSVSQLYALSKIKSDGQNLKIFEGAGRHCSKKVTGYNNCCRVEKPGVGWGKHIGAHCTPDEKYLMQLRQKNLCVYSGKHTKKNKLGMTSITKHYFCCFSNILEKTIQVQARAQLGMNFGGGDHPDCRGLTLQELERVDFTKIDFSEFAAEVQSKMVLPDSGDVKARVLDSFSNMNGFDEKSSDRASNKRAGINGRIDAEAGGADE